MYSQSLCSVQSVLQRQGCECGRSSNILHVLLTPASAGGCGGDPERQQPAHCAKLQFLQFHWLISHRCQVWQRFPLLVYWAAVILKYEAKLDAVLLHGGRATCAGSSAALWLWAKHRGLHAGLFYTHTHYEQTHNRKNWAAENDQVCHRQLPVNKQAPVFFLEWIQGLGQWSAE